MPTPSKGPGRPPTGRKRTPITLLPAEIDRLDQIRKNKPRGVFLGKLIMAQSIDPFHAFRHLKK